MQPDYTRSRFTFESRVVLSCIGHRHNNDKKVHKSVGTVNYNSERELTNSGSHLGNLYFEMFLKRSAVT